MNEVGCYSNLPRMASDIAKLQTVVLVCLIAFILLCSVSYIIDSWRDIALVCLLVCITY